jgi:hypothetical protein
MLAVVDRCHETRYLALEPLAPSSDALPDDRAARLSSSQDERQQPGLRQRNDRVRNAFE